MDDDDLLAEQREFYRARAPIYDDWWQRRGRYRRYGAGFDEWNHQVAVVENALETFGATGDELELAGGTGWWSQRLARTADHLTVVDGSPEVLALNRERTGDSKVEYIVADIFDWHPDRTFDIVFFSFWLSHVPRNRFGAFWQLVRECLSSRGRVFFVDNRNDPTPTANMPEDPYVVEYRQDEHVRQVDDGSEYRVVKVMYEPDELQALLDAKGWNASVDATRWFIFGSAQPR